MVCSILGCVLIIPGGAFFIPRGCLIHPHPALIIPRVGLNWSPGMNRSLYLSIPLCCVPACACSVLLSYACTCPLHFPPRHLAVFVPFCCISPPYLAKILPTCVLTTASNPWCPPMLPRQRRETRRAASRGPSVKLLTSNCAILPLPGSIVLGSCEGATPVPECWASVA